MEYEIIDEVNNEFINYIDIDSYNMEAIPYNVSISTMSLTCYLGTLFNIENIYRYMILESDTIVALKSGKGIKCLDDYKPKFKSTTKNSKKNFFNQMTIIIKIVDDKFLNIKLFKNGSIQITGCKLLSDANIGINKLITKLKEKLLLKITDTDMDNASDNASDNALDKVSETESDKVITFVEDVENLNVSKFKIDLINSNFGVNYLINKELLFGLLTEKNVLCRLSSIHACVNIKYKIRAIPDNMHTEDKPNYVSIFVFQTGNIIITGAKQAIYVRDAYHYIVNFLNKNKDKIIKKDMGKMYDEYKDFIDSIE